MIDFNICHSVLLWTLVHCSFSLIPTHKVLRDQRTILRVKYVHVWESALVTILVLVRFVYIPVTGMDDLNTEFDYMIMKVAIGYQIYDVLAQIVHGSYP